MAGEFVALAELLRAPAAPAVVPQLDASGRAARAETFVTDASSDAGNDAVRDARLFRARLADAFDDAAARLLRELASEVIARELRLAPCDLAELVRRVRDRMPVMRVRVAACDIGGIAAAPLAREGVIVLADPVLARGDAVVELASGALDARLGVRLATVLEAFA